jgi:hypothetical protein
MSRSDYEDQLTFATAEYLDLKGWLYTHFPAGEYRPKRTGAKLKRMGLKRGVPDFLIFERWVDCNADDEECDGCRPLIHCAMRNSGNGVALELKSPTGRLTKEQKIWIGQMRQHGWAVHVCRTIHDVMDATACILL